jgi:hypothetical protein
MRTYTLIEIHALFNNNNNFLNDNLNPLFLLELGI